MRIHLLTALAAFLLVPAAFAQGQEPVVAETIQLNHIDAKSVPAIVDTVQGIEQLTCDFKSNSVTARGSQKAVDAFKAKIKQADVQPILYCFDMRLVRHQVDKRGKRTETVLMEPTIVGADNRPATISLTGEMGGFAFLVTPHHDTDKTVTLAVEVRELGAQGEVVRSGKNTRRVTLGETARITGMTDAKDKAVRQAVQQGEIASKGGDHISYYVEVRPTLNSPGVPSKP